MADQHPSRQSKIMIAIAVLTVIAAFTGPLIGDYLKGEFDHNRQKQATASTNPPEKSSTDGAAPALEPGSQDVAPSNVANSSVSEQGPPDGQPAQVRVAPAAPVVVPSQPAQANCRPQIVGHDYVEAVKIDGSLRRMQSGPRCLWGPLGQRLEFVVNLCGGAPSDLRAIMLTTDDRTINDRRTNHSVEMIVQSAGPNQSYAAGTATRTNQTISIPSGSAYLKFTIEGGDAYSQLSMGVCRMAFN
jgi:hypothetical protein